MFKLLISAVLLFTLSIPTFSQTINKNKLDSLFNILIENNAAMGSVAIAKNGNIVYQRHFGYSYMDADKKKPVDSNTLFRIGSITKMFTAATIFQLIEEGKLSLQTKLAKYFPKVPNAAEITIKMLLGHRSGLGDYLDSLINGESWIIFPQTQTKILDRIYNSKPSFQPDSSIKYSNSGYYLLARIIEKIEQKPYSDVIDKRIIKKLGLNHTFYKEVNTSSTQTALGYAYNDKWEQKTDFDFSNAGGVGDLLSTPTDLIKFSDALFSGKIVTGKSLEAMMPNMNDEGFNKMGLGIIGMPYSSHWSFGHTGGTYGQHSIIANFIKDSLVYSVTTNSIDDNFNDILVSILDIMFHGETDLKKYITKNYPVTEADVKKLEGVYIHKESGSKFYITIKGNKLFAKLNNQLSYQYKPSEKNTFVFKVAGAVLKFNPESNELILHQNGGATKFIKE